MKVNVEIECSPEEARRFLGLPDVTRVNEAYVDALTNAMSGSSNMDQLNELTRQVAPMGQMGLKLFQQLMENGVAMAMSGGGSKPRKDDDE